MSLPKIEKLTKPQYERVKSVIPMSVLGQFGDSRGFSYFCKFTKDNNLIEKCGLTGESRELAYATYLLNSKGKTGTLLDDAFSHFDNADKWSKMSIEKAPKKQPVVKVSKAGNVTKQTIDSLSYAEIMKNSSPAREMVCKTLTNAQLKELIHQTSPRVGFYTPAALNKLTKDGLCQRLFGNFKIGKFTREQVTDTLINRKLNDPYFEYEKQYKPIKEMAKEATKMNNEIKKIAK